ncbi:hypothetical protein [Shinella sp. HZN7]|uniref:hypothetical protein n=1 Tax=Shinella sp. (strain HZN7) TaxID=879274 RepID=UPI000AD6AA3A|nr:hypothetical protein [Shinella sp. HZN7]
MPRDAIPLDPHIAGLDPSRYGDPACTALRAALGVPPAASLEPKRTGAGQRSRGSEQ